MTEYVSVNPYSLDWEYEYETEEQRLARVEASAWYLPFKPVIDRKRDQSALAQEYGPTHGALVSDHI